MKLSLEEAQDKRKLGRTISLIKAQIEYILWLLSNTTSNTPVADAKYHYKAATKAGLQDASTVPVESIGRVDGIGADNGMFCVPNPSKSGWVALNFWE